MNISELTKDNWIIFAIKHYNNPSSVTYEDFEEDLNKFKYIKRLLKRYELTGELITPHFFINTFRKTYGKKRMALWGRNDNVGSGGTVTLNYSSRLVIGSGTTFGQTGAAKTGDVIRFGIRGSGGTYFGDAVIVGIASTTQLSIASTGGLSGAAIAGTSFYVSELPKYTILDSSFSNINDASTTLKNFGITGTATTNAGVGTNIIPTVAPSTLIVGDTLLNGGNNIVISTIGAATITLGSTISSGISTNDALTFKRFTGGYDKQVYGISTHAYSSASTSFRTEGEGWVGVTTYIDTHGNLRIKKEILVAMSGITTGTDGILYPTNK